MPCGFLRAYVDFNVALKWRSAGHPRVCLQSLLAIAWCAFSSSKMFSVGLELHNQQVLIAYPCMLLYGVFAMLAVF